MDVDLFTRILSKINEKSKPVSVAPKEKEPEEPRPKRCQHLDCKTKIKISDFPCRCKKFYCSSHKFSDDHGCSFDYKAQGKDLLMRQLPEVKCSKLDKL